MFGWFARGLRRGSASLVHLCIPGVGAIAASQVGTLIVANCAGNFFRGSFPEAGSGGSKATQDLPTSHEPPRARRPGGSHRPRRLTRPPGGHPGLSDLSRSPRERLPLATGGPRGSHETTHPGPADQEAPSGPRRPTRPQAATQDSDLSRGGHPGGSRSPQEATRLPGDHPGLSDLL